MKRIIVGTFSLVLVLGLTQYASALSLKLGGSVNYYVLRDSFYKEIYGKGGLMISGYLSVELVRKLECRAEVNYFKDKGKTTVEEDEITYTFTPIIFGIRMRVTDAKIVSTYLGLGAGPCSYKEELPKGYEDVSGSAVGLYGEAGIYLKLPYKILLDLNIRYLEANAEPFDEKIKLGGFRAGIGVVYWFNL